VREVLAARSGRDFTSVSAPRYRRARSRPSLGRLVLAFVVRRPGRLFGGLLFAAIAAFISVNALTMQPAPHPAPLFGKGERDAAARQTAPTGRSVESAPRRYTTQPAVPGSAAAPRAPAAPMTIDDVLAPVPPSRPGTQDRSVSETSSIPRDPIGELIRSGSPQVAIAPEPDLRLMAAQRALTKLGYGPLTDDGLFGPMTRNAIERFEREQGLEVTGLLVPQTIRALSVRSGVDID
jgi:hypothetical protein